MRSKILVSVTAAFALSSFGLAPCVANAQPSAAQMKKDAEIENPVAADAAVAKDEANAAKTKAHKAHRQAKIAKHKAKHAAKKTHEAAKNAGHT